MKRERQPSSLQQEEKAIPIERKERGIQVVFNKETPSVLPEQSTITEILYALSRDYFYKKHKYQKDFITYYASL